MIGGLTGLLRIEFRRSLGLLCLPLLLAAGLFVANTTLPAEVRLWPATSNATLYAATLLGPLTGGLSAYVAGRNRRDGVDDMLATTAKPKILREIATWAGTALWGALACVAVACFYVYLALREATWGGPSLAPLLVGLLALAAYSAIGYAAGHHLPSRFAAPLVAVLLFVPQTLLSTLGYSLEFFVPLTDATVGTDVFRHQEGVWGWRALWFCALVGLALSVVAMKGRSRAPWGAFMACCVAVVTVAGALASVDASGALSGKPVPYEPVCEEGEVTVCVHPAYRAMLPETAATINAVARPVVGLPGVPETAEQRESLASGPASGAAASYGKLPFTLDVEKREGFGYGFLAARVAQSLTGYDELVGNRPGLESEEESTGGSVDYSCQASPTEAQKTVAHWLLRQSGLHDDPAWSVGCTTAEKAFDRFASLNPDERQRWLEENFASLRAGDISLKDLP